jgi:hypothetical protein
MHEAKRPVDELNDNIMKKELQIGTRICTGR